ncbi:MAG TPA: GNAT family N-acetyltransferase [candidate division Zixibacteria bacterium]|nr:GNAT family N-acetyltransferase [candidate division Zixibacteria bacterium]
MIERLDFSYGTMDDFSSIFKLLEITGWGETEDDIRRVINNPDNKYILLCTPEGEAIAVTLAVKNGTLGFIGHVIVMPKFRGMGIGQEIMIEAINYLEHNGCKTIKLDAVKEAQTLYERVGFQFELNSLRFKLDLSTEEKITSYKNKRKEFNQIYPVHNIKEDDLSQVFELDSEIFECNRDNLLFSLFEEFPEYSFITRDTKDFLVGYSFGIYKNNILIIRAGVSDSIETTVNLIDAAITTAQSMNKVDFISIGIPENSKWVVDVVKKLGFEQTSYSLRMYRGEKTTATINPAIFAIGDPAKG